MDRRRIIPIFVIVFTNILGSGVILPILPLVAEGQFGATALQATTLAAVFFAAQFIAAPWLGRLSDRYGRRPILILSQIGTVLSFVMFSLAAPLGRVIDGTGFSIGISGGLFILYLARLLDGITGGNITTAQAYITDISSEETRAQALGTISAAFGMGFIFGPAFGGFLSGISLVTPFIGAAIITSGSVLLTTVMLKESLPPEERSTKQTQQEELPLRQYLQNRTVFLLFLITFVTTLAFAALQSTFALYAERVVFPQESSSTVARNVGLFLTIIGVFTVITQAALIKPLVRRFGERRLILLGQVSLMIAFGGFAILSMPFLIGLFAIPVALGNGINQPSLQSLITRFGDARTHGRLLGLYQSSRSLALIFGPIWAGFVFQAISPRAPFAIAVPLLCMGLTLGLLLQRHSFPQKAAQPFKS
ncbi:MAG: MFS transporter [Ardenticatenaceae bacterium]|nr:MFS transporter [Ardenticatenaceae bacterium]MCB9445712.1 MFS transporter [Ardenticatenaceae bacterium]